MGYGHDTDFETLLSEQCHSGLVCKACHFRDRRDIRSSMFFSSCSDCSLDSAVFWDPARGKAGFSRRPSSLPARLPTPSNGCNQFQSATERFMVLSHWWSFGYVYLAIAFSVNLGIRYLAILLWTLPLHILGDWCPTTCFSILARPLLRVTLQVQLFRHLIVNWT